MKRILSCLIIVLAVEAGAQNVIIVTNNIYDLNPDRDQATISAGINTRLTLYATDGVDPINLSGGRNQLRLYDVRDNWELTPVGPEIRGDAAQGWVIWRIPPLNSGTYEFRGANEQANTNLNFNILRMRITITPTPSAGGGATTLRKGSINLMGVYRLGDTLDVDGDTIDTTHASIDPNGLTYTFGEPVGGMSAPIWQAAPYENAQWRLVPNFAALPDSGDPLALWWHPTESYWFLDQPYAFTQGPLDTNVLFIGTNVAAFSFTGVTNTFIVPPAVSNIQVKLWGGAGGQAGTANVGGQGGYVTGFLPVTAGESLYIVVAGTTNISQPYIGQFPNGGKAALAGGGGSSIIARGTNILAVAGGGGGARLTSLGGNGGGLTGVTGSGSTGGTGGTQTTGGVTDGAWLSAGSTTSINTSGGGGGWYGGGYGNATGGGGSSYIDMLIAGVTFSFANTFDDDYAAGVGVPSASTQTAGGPGRIVIRW